MIDKAINRVINSQVGNDCFWPEQTYPMIHFICNIVYHDAIVKLHSAEEYIN